MFLQKTNAKNIQSLLIIGCLLVVIGLLFSKAILSLSTAYLVVLFLTIGNFKEGIDRIKSSKVIISFILFTLYYCCSLLWSENTNAGISDLISKGNLFLLPIVIIALPPIQLKNKKIILLFFAWSVVLTSLINFIYFNSKDQPGVEIRNMSIFTSHIRFSLFDIFALFILLLQKQTKMGVKLLSYIGICWLLFYTYYAQVLSGILVLFSCLIYGAIYGLKSSLLKSKIIATVFLASTIFLIVFTLFNINKLNSNKKNISHYPTYTKLGHLYYHDTTSKAMENGYPLNCYINFQELDSTWKTKSKTTLNLLSKHGFSYQSILIRYLTSKGLTKDAEGVNKLSSQDIKNIERGIPTILALETGLKKRIYEIHYEWNSQENPNGHSILHRIEYWKTGWYIFKQHWLLGTGIGDYKTDYQQAYKHLHSKLETKNRLESHNQFLGILIATGILGLTLFLMHILYTITNFMRQHTILALLFYVICITSFLVEDTLTTLAGMSFYGFFLGLFSSNYPLTFANETTSSPEPF